MEFRGNPAFTGPRLASSDTFKAGTSYVPSADKWKAIQKLGGAAKVVYWRVRGRASGSTVILASGQVLRILTP